MAGKHYIIATQTGYLVDNVTGYPYEFHSKEAAVKALAEEVKTAAQECRRSHKTCSVVGSARKGSVQIRVGGRQGYHLWQRYVINERPGGRKPPREARAAASTAGGRQHATKKTPAQREGERSARALKEERARIARERKERLDAALATTLETRRADPYNIASWETQPKRHHATKKSAAQLDREIAEATEFQRRRNLPGVEVRRMFGTRYAEIHLSRGGVDLGSRTDMLKRGKVVSTMYVLPPVVDR